MKQVKRPTQVSLDKAMLDELDTGFWPAINERSNRAKCVVFFILNLCEQHGKRVLELPEDDLFKAFYGDTWIGTNKQRMQAWEEFRLATSIDIETRHLRVENLNPKAFVLVRIFTCSSYNGIATVGLASRSIKPNFPSESIWGPEV